MLHADTGRAIASHGMAHQAAALPRRNGAVMRVHIGHQIPGDEILEIAGGDRARIHRAVMHRLGIGKHHDHVPGALGEGPFYRLRHMDFLAPLLGADGIAMQGIDDRVTAIGFLAITGRQENQNIAIGAVALQTAFQGGPMYFEVLDRHLGRAGNDIGHIIFGLPDRGTREQGQQTERQ